jgi:hypothetical protein
LKHIPNASIWLIPKCSTEIYLRYLPWKNQKNQKKWDATKVTSLGLAQLSI